MADDQDTQRQDEQLIPAHIVDPNAVALPFPAVQPAATPVVPAVHPIIDVRQAFVNAGGDVNAVGQEGQRYKVGNSSSRERAQMFDWMLDKGFTPSEIVEMARQQ